MGQAKQRKAAHKAGRPWAPTMPAAVSSVTGSSRAAREMERLSQLSHVAQKESLELLRSARRATDETTRYRHLHSIFAGATALMEAEVESAYAATDSARRLKESVACRKGCAFCCHMAVEVTALEAILVWRRALASPVLVAAVKASAPATANVAAAERWRRKMPCPMLGDDGACQVYEDRPGSCRAFASTDAQRCETALRTAGTADEDLRVPIVLFPKNIDNAISIGVRRACAAEGLQSCNVELTAALLLLANDATAAVRWLAGETVFKPYP